MLEYRSGNANYNTVQILQKSVPLYITGHLDCKMLAVVTLLYMYMEHTYRDKVAVTGREVGVAEIQ